MKSMRVGGEDGQSSATPFEFEQIDFWIKLHWQHDDQEPPILVQVLSDGFSIFPLSSEHKCASLPKIVLNNESDYLFFVTFDEICCLPAMA